MKTAKSLVKKYLKVVGRRPGGDELAWAVNNPERWHQFGPTPSVDLVRFQERINKVVGKTVNGFPIVRIVDMQKRMQWEAGHWRLKYRYFSAEIDTPSGPQFMDCAPPRYVLEERIEPARYLPGWESARWYTETSLTDLVVATDAELVEEAKRPTITRIDILGEPPVEGLYQPFWDVCSHAHGCCDRYPRLKCYGVYRNPGDIELEMLQYTRQEIEKRGAYESPTEPMSTRTLAEIAMETRTFKQEKESESLAKWRALFLDRNKTHGWRQFETNSKRLRHGRYFFTQGRSGLFAPGFFQNN